MTTRTYGRRFSGTFDISHDSQGTEEPQIENGSQVIHHERKESVRKEVGLCAASYKAKLLIAYFAMADLTFGLFYSIIAPFFPKMAAQKGLSGTATGAVFSAFEVAGMVSTPLWGLFLPQIGGKFAYVAGLFVTGACSFMFAFMEDSPGGDVLTGLGIAIRVIQGFGASAYGTAAFAITAQTFPAMASTAFGILEMAFNSGSMLGPLVGGALYEAGGFKFPFLLMGALVFVAALVSLKLLPSQKELEDAPPPENKTKSILKMVTNPLTWVSLYFLVVTGTGMGFLNASLSLHLDKFGLSTVAIGAIFIADAGCFAIMTPFWGALCDKCPKSVWPMLIIGTACTGIAYQLLGPAPFLPFLPKGQLWLIILALIIDGGSGAVIIGTLSIFFGVARSSGLGDSMDAYGLVSSIFLVGYQIGAFIGPILGGALVDTVQFPMAASITGFVKFSASIFLILYLVVSKSCGKVVVGESETEEEKKPLLNSDT